jgi:hypothetical protein
MTHAPGLAWTAVSASVLDARQKRHNPLGRWTCLMTSSHAMYNLPPFTYASPAHSAQATYQPCEQGVGGFGAIEL